MGKGDKRTKRGKITIGSYGKSRPHKVATSAAAVPAAPAKAAATTPKADKKKKAQ